MFSSSSKVVAIAAGVAFFLLLFHRESTCTIVLFETSRTQPWKYTLSQTEIHEKFLFLICDFLRYFFENGRPIPSIDDTHASTPMLLELSLENQWSTVILPVKKFQSRHLSRVHRTLSVVCEVTKTASASTGIVGISCSDVFVLKIKKVLWSCMVVYFVIPVFVEHVILTKTCAV